MEKKNNGVLISVIVILVIVILGLIGYIAYDKGLIFNNGNNVEENNNGNEVNDTEDDVVEQTVPTDMALVSTKLNEFGLDTFINREYSDWNNGNLLNDSSNKLNLLNSYFNGNNLTTSSCDGQCAVVSLETYKAKYAEVYGSLASFEYDTKNAWSPIFKIGDAIWNISNDYVIWNQVWGPLGFDITLEATSVTYDENNNNYVITGNMMATEWDNNTQTNVSIGSKGTFKITYVNDGTKHYLTGIIISSTEN